MGTYFEPIWTLLPEDLAIDETHMNLKKHWIQVNIGVCVHAFAYQIF